MKKMHCALSFLLTLALIAGFFPALTPEASAAPPPSAASSSTGTANGVTLRQTAEWDSGVPGEKVVRVSLDITSRLELQSTADVVFLIDRSITQPLDEWKTEAKDLADLLDTPGMRFALVAYQSRAEKVLDFTESAASLKTAVDGIQQGANCNCYAGLKEVRELLESRADQTRPACVVLFSNGRFNMNHIKMHALAPQLNAIAPIYYNTPDTNMGAGNFLRDIRKLTAAVGKSRTYPHAALTVKLADGFTLSQARLSIDGETSSLPYDEASGTYQLPSFQMGQSLRVSLTGKLADTTRTGTLPAAVEASLTSGTELNASTAQVFVERSGYTVTYDGSGSDNPSDAPTDSTLYASGSTVPVKPSTLRKTGWSFSGWLTDTGAHVQDAFAIHGNTNLTPTWGRAFVKLSSSTIPSHIAGKQMLSRAQIFANCQQAFYKSDYWNNLASVTLEIGAQVPPDRVREWDITDTSVAGNTPGAVMAWVVTNAADSTKYDLHISGKDGLTAPANANDLFNSCSASTITGLANLDVSQVTSMKNMFSNCKNLRELSGISGWNTSQVTDMTEMFLSCSNLESLAFGSGWNTSKVTTMKKMFEHCRNLVSVSFGTNWNTGAVKNMEYTFDNCQKLTTLNVKDWNTSNVTSMSYMFQNCVSLQTLDLSGWNTKKAYNMNYMFRMEPRNGEAQLENIIMGTNWDTPSADRMEYMFSGCGKLKSLNIGSWNTGSVYLMYNMFEDCKSLETLPIQNWNTSNVTDMGNMFKGCSGLVSLDVGTVTDAVGTKWDTSKVTSMRSMFEGCSKLTSLPVSDWNTAAVTGMYHLFAGCSGLTGLDVSTWNTSKVDEMSGLFDGCSGLTSLNVSGWDTSNVTTMSTLFYGCSGLTSLDVDRWNTSKVKNMQYMFANCTKLTALNLAAWDMTQVTSLYYMFHSDAALASIGRSELTVAVGCETGSMGNDYPDWNSGAHTNLQTITIKTTNGDTIYPETKTSSNGANALSSLLPELSASEPAQPEPEQTEPAQSEPTYTESEQQEPTAEPVQEEPATEPAQVEEPLIAGSVKSAPRAVETDANGRPLYAKDKDGLWDCGQVREDDIINYTLELQYLSEDGSTHGVSGDLEVTNPIPVPAGLTLDHSSISISGPTWIKSTSGGLPSGRILEPPTATADGVLHFRVTGLSAGAKFLVTYTCTVPAADSNGRVFLNTAFVEDNGLTDYADPVLYTMDGAAPVTTYDVTFAYYRNMAPAGAPEPSTFKGTYLAGTRITLPSPAVPGYAFSDWTSDIDGSAHPAGSSCEVNADTVFTGTWSSAPSVPQVTVRYDFAGDLPENYDLIRGTLLEGVPTAYPANTTASAPTLAAVPAGYSFQWLTPVDANGRFQVGAGPEITITGRWTRTEYAVTYQYDPGAPLDAPALPADANHPWGSSVSLIEEPGDTATHLFLGWTVSEDTGGTRIDVDADGKFTMPMDTVTVTGRWAAIPAPADQEVLVEPNGGVWMNSDEDQTLLLSDYNSQVAGGTFQDAEKEGSEFLSWKVQDESGTFAKRVTAQWKDPTPPTPITPPSSSGGGSSVRYFLITSETEGGGSILPGGRTRVAQGASRTFTITPRAGSVILDVEVDGESVGAVESYTFKNVQRNHSIKALFTPREDGGVSWLDTEDHRDYLHGFLDGTFRPEGSMSRSEAAQMFYNLLLEREPASPAGYSDVPQGAWYEEAANTLHALGIMQGDEEGRFHPNRPITRAEFAAIAARFAEETAACGEDFRDVGRADWFYDPVMSAAALGWINGYEDGSFRPRLPIARSEAAAIVNRMLGRRADRAYADSHPEMLRRFPDVTADHWAYYEILEAANAHDYTRTRSGGESWSPATGEREAQ